MFKFDLTIENLKRGLSNPFQIFDETVLQHGYRIPSILVNNYVGIGTNVFSRQWDVLIILDCCRVDALRAVAPEYEFIADVGTLRTVGGSTPEWMSKTFSPKFLDEIRDTTYLTATAQLRGIIEEKLPANRRIGDSHLAYKLLQLFDTVDITDLERVEYLFKYESKGTEGPLGHVQGFTPPRYITERAISVNREHSPKRIILHYMQPHAPYVAEAVEEDRPLLDHEERPLRYLRDTGDFDKVWNTYLNELRYVLDDVELLLENIDAESVVITADHGEAFGEWGIYGHTIGSLHPKVRTVPWTETSGTDSGSYNPTIEDPETAESAVDTATEDLLEAMGYKF